MIALMESTGGVKPKEIEEVSLKQRSIIFDSWENVLIVERKWLITSFVICIECTILD